MDRFRRPASAAVFSGVMETGDRLILFAAVLGSALGDFDRKAVKARNETDISRAANTTMALGPAERSPNKFH